MQLQHEQSYEQTQEQVLQDLQRQVEALTTENLLLKEQLAQKEQFTAMIAHELRGPLTPIINYAQMLVRHSGVLNSTELSPKQVRQRTMSIQRNTNIIVSQARRMARLVNDLLDASRLGSGQFSLIREDCDICTLAKEAVEQLRPLAPYHQLVCEVPEGKLVGNWDGGRLQQALGNLLDNAIKYSDEATTITVRVWSADNMAHVSVHNQGASIPSADISQLFRPYVRLQTSSARKGSGLGLFITKSIIEAHAGSLRLEPHADIMNGEGPRGTTFIFDLPL